MDRIMTDKELRDYCRNHPEEIRNIFTSFDQKAAHINDELLDSLLGLSADSLEHTLDHFELEQTHGIEQFTYEATPYDYIRRFLRIVQPQKNDVIYDLGAGYGRIGFYGALTSLATYISIEIVPERVALSESIRSHFHVENAQFIAGNVLDQDFSDGTAFFLFNPFLEKTNIEVLNRLRKIAEQRTIYIATWGGGESRRYERETWLKEIPQVADEISLRPNALKIFMSATTS